MASVLSGILTCLLKGCQVKSGCFTSAALVSLSMVDVTGLCSSTDTAMA